ncbi:MAG: ribonuclease HII [Candidatus Yanofskybacteria bacterium]|nr:ribonuclease HII [Candidatus Yanofskybacteria bacterium]
MVTLPRKTLERNLLVEGYAPLIGVDEVGMACLAGPVVVCAVAVDPDFYDHAHPALANLRDSKALLPHQRERYAEALLRQTSFRWRIASRDPVVIDRINIYQASRDAMREAVQKLVAGSFKRESPEHKPMILVDGNKLVSGLELSQRAIVKGDRRVWAIAAASILAKVHRDRLMIEYAREYPDYGFEQHKGYPTRLHYARLKQYGPCALHRRSFLRKLTQHS